MKKKPIYFIFCLVFLVMGVAIATWGYQELEHAKQSESWPSVSGQITKSELIEKKRTGGRKKGRRGKSYKSVIEYQYQVEGKSYFNNRLGFSGSRSDRSGAQAMVDSYPIGKPVNVFYNPVDPQDSALVAGVTTLTYLPLAAGLLFLIVGLVSGFKALWT